MLTLFRRHGDLDPHPELSHRVVWFLRQLVLFGGSVLLCCI